MLERRRIVKELAAHLDDAVGEFRALGLSAGAALEQALRRLGDPAAIAAAFSAARVRRRAWSSGKRLRSPAWIAVGAMSLVTAWAAELPQSSGAKPPASCASPLHRSNAAATRRLGAASHREALVVGTRCGP